MKLSDLLKFNNIYVQAHDNPDADAIGSGYGVYKYLIANGKSPRLIYSGKRQITKSNLVLMVKNLEIPIEYITELYEVPELLITVDCQYGESNVTKFDAKNVAIIDHHQVSQILPELSEVRSNVGSCSAVVHHMLEKEGFDDNLDENLATALYYGLMTDTNNFTEIHHPLDKDLRDDIKFNHMDITRFKNSNLSIDELGIAGRALLSAFYNEEYRFGIVESEPCDPNILGIISDMLLEVDKVDTCLVYSILPSGVKISVRSCIRETRANELAEYIARGVGNGGGHIVKAGGFLQNDLLSKEGISQGEGLYEFFNERMVNYFKHSEVIYAASYKADISSMLPYKKRHLHLGYVDAGVIFDEGTKLQVRTMEGDIEIKVTDGLYIMIGISGEIYPQERENFEKNYWYSDAEYVYPGEYEPNVKVGEEGKAVKLTPYVKSCISSGQNKVYVKRLDHRVKLFTEWDPDRYYVGKVGDYLACREEDTSDVYIIDQNIFDMTYEEPDSEATECEDCHEHGEEHHVHVD